MHLVERYALGTSSKIGRPYILDSFFPLPAKEYITFHPISKDSKNYDHWEEVLFLIHPYLEKRGIKIVQVGGRGEKPFPFCIHTQGNTSFNDLAYIIKKSKLHLSTDSIGSHLAGFYNIPQVCLFSNNYIDNVRSYWGDPARKIFLEPQRESGQKPNFVLSENPKTINTIKIEDIARAVLNSLGIEFAYDYKSVAIGPLFEMAIIETACDQIVNPSQFGANSIFCRFDLIPDESILRSQLSNSNVNLITDRPIDPSILREYREKFVEIIFNIKSLDQQDILSSVGFLRNVSASGIRLVLISSLPKSEIDKIKLEFVEFPPIIIKNSVRPQFILDYVKKSGDEGLSKIRFKTKRFILSGGKFYLSSAHFKNRSPCGGFHDNLSNIIDSPEFWEESDHFYFLYAKN